MTDQNAHLLTAIDFPLLDAIRPKAEALLGRSVSKLEIAGAGANGVVFRVLDGSGFPSALKCYRISDFTSGTRVKREWSALSFLHNHGLRIAPEPYNWDLDEKLLLMEWIDGEPIGAHSADDLTSALEILNNIMDLSEREGALVFGDAKDACLSTQAIVDQIDRRLANFVDHPALNKFISEIFMPYYESALETISPGLIQSPIEKGLQRLIPADFGFHNAIRASHGGLRFMDFDYFGWDDPVKMASDFTLHPAISCTQSEKEIVIRTIGDNLSKDTDFFNRFERQLPLHRLRWAAILLNLFAQDRFKTLVDSPENRERRLSIQIGKAVAILDCVT
jgi:hypothetical protein